MANTPKKSSLNSKIAVDKEKMMEAFYGLLKIRSVYSEPTDDAPFGEGVKQALQYTLGLADSLGFKTKNYDNYIGEVSWGEGEPFGILCHLDVVPEGDLCDWDTDPYTPTIKDGKLYARGALDDKCGSMSILFAMKALADAGFTPKREIRLILGCNEESGWKCIEHYKKVAVLPEEGISPDADFPVIYAEKGIAHIVYKFKKSADLLWIKGGTAANVVCDKCEAEVKNAALYAGYTGISVNGSILQSTGVAAHGSTPQKGKNAMAPMIYCLEKAELVESGIYDGLFGDKFKFQQINDETGYLTFSPDIISSDGDYVYITVDVRYPSTVDTDFVLEQLKKAGSYTIESLQKPLYLPKDSGLVKTLCDIYNEVTGENTKPVAIGGGTYARALKRGVAFGPSHGAEEDSIHKPNEYITLATLDLMNEVYLEMLKRICF